MLVPLLIAMLGVPRLAIALLRSHAHSSTFALVAGAMMLIATLVLAFTRPVSCKSEGSLTNGRFILAVFLLFFIGSISAALFWFRLNVDKTAVDWKRVLVPMIAISAFSSLVY
ncbi:MAG: hypothetical protein JWO97_1479, partial [Acidobacteria bacterium]|nr:hypothetical protein [Acidobacteriota bacterium]